MDLTEPVNGLPFPKLQAQQDWVEFKAIGPADEYSWKTPSGIVLAKVEHNSQFVIGEVLSVGPWVEDISVGDRVFILANGFPKGICSIAQANGHFATRVENIAFVEKTPDVKLVSP